MRGIPALARWRRIPSPRLAALGLAASVIVIVLAIRGFGSLNVPYFQVEVKARDVTSGEMRWTFSERTNNHPSYGADLLLVPIDGTTVAIDDSGATRWRLEDFEAVSSQAVGDLVYLIGRSPNETVAVDRRTGGIQWRAEGWLVEVGDAYAIVRSGARIEVVVASTGDVVHVADEAREAMTAGHVVAYFVERTLHVVRPESDVSWELPDARWRNLLGIVDPFVVVSSRADTMEPDTGRRQQVVAAYDSRAREVRWEVTVPAYRNEADLNGSILRLHRESDVMEIDVATGEVLPAAATPAVAPFDLAGTVVDQTAIISRMVRLSSRLGPVTMLSTGREGSKAPTTVAVDPASGLLVWSMVGALPVAGNRNLVATYEAASFRFLDAQTGEELSTVPGSQRWRAGIATEQAIAVLGSQGLTVVDAEGRGRIVAEGLSPTARIEGGSGDVVVVHERRRLPGASAEKRFLTAFDIADNRRLWEHQVPFGGTTEVGEEAVVLVTRSSTIEIDLRTGEINESENGSAREPEEPSRLVVAVFDAELRRLLWSQDIGEDEQVTVTGDVVLFVDVTRTKR